MTGEQLARIGSVDNPRARHAAAILPFYLEFNRREAERDGIHVHDSTVISYLLAPQHYRSVDMPVRVDCGHGVGRGKTWAAVERHARGPVGAPPAGDDPHRGRCPCRGGPRARTPRPHSLTGHVDRELIRPLSTRVGLVEVVEFDRVAVRITEPGAVGD